MKCSKCAKPIIYNNPNYCKDHFIEYVENKVFSTIKKYKLIDDNDKVAVAASGGKDSLTVLHILKQKYHVEAIAIDEGIPNYRQKTIEDLKTYCKKEKIKMRIYSYRTEFKKDLENMSLNNKTPCSVCGTLRRYLLNKYSKKYDVIATGHNLDDEAQAIMMNLLKSNFDLAQRIGPKTGTYDDFSFTKRVKPLYFLKEREIKAYTIVIGLTPHFAECPNMRESFRAKVRIHLNTLEFKQPGIKKKLVDNFLALQSKLKSEESKEMMHCQKCGFVSKEDICRACQLIAEV